MLLNAEVRNRLFERFLRYVKIDTQSVEGAECYPSTEKQKDLLRLLVDELKALGLTDADMDEHGYVFATLPSNLPEEMGVKPAIGFLAHVDTSPEVSGADVKPIIWHKYDGRDMNLPGDPTQIITWDGNPVLKRYIDNTIITSDGTTLLGADDKAGIAEIMTALEVLLANPQIPHPTIRIGFTPDEEVGSGTKHFDLNRFDCNAAYTMDGGEIGEVEDETFAAWLATFEINGANVHPGYAKNKMVNSIRPMAAIIEGLADQPAPETTEGREGYLHPYGLTADVAKSTLKVLIRGFTDEDIEMRKTFLLSLCDRVKQRFPKVTINLTLVEQYKNMKAYLDRDPRVTEFALEAVRRAGIEPIQKAIRGGTDGSRLSEKGLPTPNIFAGGHNFHSKLEFVPLESMVKAVEVIVHLAKIWASA